MKRERERENDTSGKIRKKRKSNELGIFAYNIPIKIKVGLLSKVRVSKHFIPTFQESHIGIAYFQCNDPENKEKAGKELLALAPKIKSIEFEPKKTEINEAISKLQTISKIINTLYTHIGLSSIPNEKRKKPKNYVDIHLKPVKDLALEILAINYMQFDEAFLFLKTSMQDTENSALNNDFYIEWIIIFYWCWFVWFKVSRETIARYEIFFTTFRKKLITKLFKSLKKVTHVIKYLVFDILCQYFYYDEAFNNETEVLEKIRSILKNNEATKVAIPAHMFMDKFSAIFSSKIIQVCSTLSKRILKRAVKEFIDNTYLASLPESVTGITLCNRVVVIRRISNVPKDYEDENTIIGVTLMTMLHELGHFLQRIHLTNYYAWFEKAIPIYDGESEAGSMLIKKIFNAEPDYINIEATRFLLELGNWELPHKMFISQFKERNTFSKIREITKSKLQRRLKQRGDEPGTRSLIGCSRMSGRSVTIMKVKINI